jgi:hypothetical protein
MAGAEAGDPRIARGGVQLLERVAAGEPPRERVLPASRSDEEHFHAASLLGL